jgi:hypothetical protein
VEDFPGFSKEELTWLDPVRLLFAVIVDAGDLQFTGTGDLNHDPITKRYIQ